MLTIALTTLSNPVPADRAETAVALFSEIADEVVFIPEMNGVIPFEQKAGYLNQIMAMEPDWIIDISGGDLANGVLEWIDYSLYARIKSVFIGYSDLSVIINALYARSGKGGILFQPSFQENFISFRNFLLEDDPHLFQAGWRLLEGTVPAGFSTFPVIGGNIRCFLKLAGTGFMPDLEKSVIVLESRSGDYPRIQSYFNQLAQLIGNRPAILGLGQFNELDETFENSDALLLEMIHASGMHPLCIIRSDRIGHLDGGAAVWLGSSQ